MIEISSYELAILLKCSLRYSMGRETYIPNLIQELTLKYAEKLNNSSLNNLIMELGLFDYGDCKECLELRKQLLVIKNSRGEEQ